jgi:DNA-binding FadR family transcriptional regulator
VSHQRIYLAMRDGDRKQAQREMQEYILFVRDALLRSLEVKATIGDIDVEEAVLEPQV